jgi:hypothetical protein
MMIFSNDPKRHLPGDGWKGIRRDQKHGDDVFLHEEDAVAMIALSRMCESHAKDTFCLRCLPRLEAAVAAARGALDPQAPASIEELPSQGDFPEYLALVNPIAVNAFAMRLDRARKLLATKLILTSKRPEHGFDRPLAIVHHATETQVCDAIYLKSFHVRLGDGVPEAYAKRLWEAKFSLSIDGEPMIAPGPLREILSQKEIPLPRPIKDRTCLFSANRLKDDGNVDEDGWSGYMLTNGTIIHAELDGVPGGGGLVRIEVGWSFGVYSSKKRPTPAAND